MRRLYKMTDGTQRVKVNATAYIRVADWEFTQKQAKESGIKIQDYLDYLFEQALHYQYSEEPDRYEREETETP